MLVERVLVVGAGIGGLAAAAAVGQHGIAVDVVESSESASVLGVGINQPGNSLRALDALGVLEEVLAVGYPYDGNDYRDARDQRIVLVSSSLGVDGVPANCGMTRRDLHGILLRAAHAAGARVHYGTTVSDLRDTGEAVDIELSDGSCARVDLVVAFDGVRSAMRRQVLAPDLTPRYTGSVVWRKQLPRPEDVTRTILWSGERAKGGLIPMSEQEMYLLLVTQEPERSHPDPSTHGAPLRERLAEFSGPLADIRDELSDDAPGIVYSPLVEMNVESAWHRGRVIVLGDAVHTAVPHLTQGAAMAIEDAVVLGDEVARDRPLEETLEEVERLRRPRTDLVFAASHQILLQEQAITPESLPLALTGMRDHLAEQTAQVESILNQPFRGQSAHAKELI